MHLPSNFHTSPNHPTNIFYTSYKQENSSHECGCCFHLLIGTAYFIDIGCEQFHFLCGTNHFCFLTESQKPAVELITDFNFCFYGIVPVIDFVVRYVFCAEALYHRIQKRGNKLNSYDCAPAPVHGKHTLRIVFKIKLAVNVQACTFFSVRETAFMRSMR